MKKSLKKYPPSFRKIFDPDSPSLNILTQMILWELKPK